MSFLSIIFLVSLGFVLGALLVVLVAPILWGVRRGRSFPTEPVLRDYRHRSPDGLVIPDAVPVKKKQNRLSKFLSRS